MNKIVFCLSFISVLFSSSLEAGERLYKATHWLQSDQVLIQGLDKVSARIFTAEVYVNQKVHFGSLEVFVRSAYRTPDEEQPESICFVEIFDNKPGQERQQVFSGWMFASNPALSALEHPVYDIWIKEAIATQVEDKKDEKGPAPKKDLLKESPEEEEIEEQVSSDT